MKIPPPDAIVAAADLQRVHFIGIGGAGLSAIARLMLAQGVTVSGSDGTDSEVLERLRAEGATVFAGHRAEQAEGAQVVVVSTAVPEDNPEVLRAQELGLQIWPRSAGVASVMAGHRVLAVSGTHGKTTTTSLLTMALRAAGLDPTYAVGGDLAQTGRNAEQGSSGLFVDRGRRERRRLPALSPLCRHRDQCRRGPPRSLRHDRGVSRGLRRVRHHRRSGRVSGGDRGDYVWCRRPR